MVAIVFEILPLETRLLESSLSTLYTIGKQLLSVATLFLQWKIMSSPSEGCVLPATLPLHVSSVMHM